MSQTIRSLPLASPGQQTFKGHADLQAADAFRTERIFGELWR
jgi:hypothetical protein